MTMAPGPVRILGLDPGLRRTGWGLIEALGSKIRHIANGTVMSDDKAELAARLVQLYDGISAVIDAQAPDEAAVENTFVNKDAAGTLKLGQARAIALIVPAQRGLVVAEYAPNHVKKSIVGVGHADKAQVQAMVQVLLPGVTLSGPDAADALALAICHAHHRQSASRLKSLGLAK